MNEYLKKAIEIMGAIERLAAEKETEAMSFAASYALAAAAIAQAEAMAVHTATMDNALLIIGKALVAQAEAQERQAQTAVRQALAMERIVAMLERQEAGAASARERLLERRQPSDEVIEESL